MQLARVVIALLAERTLLHTDGVPDCIYRAFLHLADFLLLLCLAASEVAVSMSEALQSEAAFLGCVIVLYLGLAWHGAFWMLQHAYLLMTMHMHSQSLWLSPPVCQVQAFSKKASNSARISVQ